MVSAALKTLLRMPISQSRVPHSSLGSVSAASLPVHTLEITDVGLNNWVFAAHMGDLK